MSAQTLRAIDVVVEGVGVWSRRLPGWSASESWLAGRGAAPPAGTRPAPDIISANERRRAPESVLLALDVAVQACAQSARTAADMPNVFASAHGDLAINDYLCATLAHDPLEVSPTRFHNSVHNAAAGYWCMATGCMQSSSAISAGFATVGAGLLETALIVHSEGIPALFVAYDVAAVGPLADVVPYRESLAVALVLGPPSTQRLASLRLTTQTGELAQDPAVLQAVDAGNPAARALPLLRLLARREAGFLTLAAAGQLSLNVEIGV